ncbi:MAG: mechanosensitive ion channel family protein [Erythrobacter sp.]|uniref:mechanosensitive ion channel family protein n=1 Tax=Erythrobacter sp. TaxID=1042 RepID=UPI003C71088C
MTEWYARIAPSLPDWAGGTVLAVTVAVLAVLIALAIHAIAFRLLFKVVKASRSEADNIVLRRLARPTRYALVALALVLVGREIPALATVWERIAGFVMPALIGWIALTLVHALVKTLKLRNDIEMEDNLRARSAQTRLTIFNRLATFLIVFVTVGLMLLSVPGVRDIGVTLMASAGLAALAVGAAAQPALKALISGVQLALTEPIRIGDAVIIGGEWGWIEEIRTTYVVVKVWDERRLVVPTNKFLEEIFQNWTKTTAQLLGTVYLYVDPATELEPIRARFFDLVEDNARWDRRVRHMQVTDLTRDAIEVRLLMTAKDSPTLYDLRCDIREALIQWIAAEMPEALVRGRVISVGEDGKALGPPSARALALMEAGSGG